MQELSLTNLAIFSKNVEKINVFGENLLKKYSKIGVIGVLLHSKIEVIYVVKIPKFKIEDYSKIGDSKIGVLL